MTFAASPIPPSCGIGLKPVHWAQIIQAPEQIAWVEIHAENFFGAGGPPHRALAAIRRNHDLSIHGVGLSLGSAQGLDREHLARLAALVGRYEPALVSEHLAWNAAGGLQLPALLPLDYDEENFAVVAENVSRAQDALARRIGVENPAHYAAGGGATAETQFLRELAQKTGCGLLLDVNNVFVSSANLGFDADRYLADFPVQAVGEIHLAGHDRDPLDDSILIDSHRGPVANEVWRLFETAFSSTGPVPCLIEWDADIPAFATLIAEARKAQSFVGDEMRHARAS